MERRRPARLDPDLMTKTVRRRDKPRERWLLTRKTWKYMADAGRRLIPDGAQNHQEDVPRIEAYFQEVCQREPRFLLWRKSSYPGVLARPRRKKRARGGSVRARSPSDDVPTPVRPTELFIPHTSGGRFDLAKLRRDFFAAPPPPSPSGFSPSNAAFDAARKNASPRVETRDNDEGVLVDLLRKYLKVEDDRDPSPSSESKEVIQALRNYLKRQSEYTPADSDTDPTQRILRDHLSRYYSSSLNRDQSVQDLLNDRNFLRNLYQDLRKPKPYRGGRGGSGPSAGGVGGSVFSASSPRFNYSRSVCAYGNDENYSSTPPMSPPPLIEVLCESQEERSVDAETQTVPIPEEVLQELERAYKEKIEAATAPTSPTSPPPERRPRRRSSVDHDDVSQSVSDTIKRYLRMARKKSVDSDKADRFKRINYDKNLRNIKPRLPSDVDDDGPHKGCQTDEAWILTYRDLQFASVATTPTSPSQSHSFLSTILGRTSVGPGAGGMQKSRSSSSVVQSVSKRLWRTRSRSSSRAAASWTPQGSCCWADGAGRCVRLADTSLLVLSEVERRAVQQAALARLHQLNLGTTIKIPEDIPAVVAKPKRRMHLIKRKAITTSFFDQSRKDADKEKEPAGSVFGVPLAQCVETERALRRQHGGSRASLASLGAIERGDDSESCDSGEWGWAGLDDGGGGPKVPALVSACLSHLRRHGLHTLGLFRVSASKKRVRQLREEWERGQDSALEEALPHDVATLLKEFLRDLPDPLLCRDLYPAFLQTQKLRSRSIQWEALKLIVQLLPAAHRDTLSALLAFLAQLAAAAAPQTDQPGNRMDAANIATIFAPNILHKNKPNEPASTEQLAERADVINVVRQLVERQGELWRCPAELLHDAYIHLARHQPALLDALLLRRAECAEAASADGARLARRDPLLSAPANKTTGSEESGLPSSNAPDSNDSASEYEGASEDECVITASLHIPVARRAARAGSGGSGGGGGRRSASGGSRRDSALGSSASGASSPPSPPRPLYPRERNTSDARAVVVRQHDETTVCRATRISREIRREEVRNDLTVRLDPSVRSDGVRNDVRGNDIVKSDQRQETRREDVKRNDVAIRRDDQIVRRDDQVVRRDDQVIRRDDKVVKREEQIVRREERREERKEEKREGTMLYKRGELISSAQSRPA